MATIKLPKMRVQLDDGAEHDIELRMTDQLRYDMVRAKNKWPVADEAQALAGAVAVAAALIRTGLASGALDVVVDRIAGIGMLDADGELVEDDEGGEDVDPT